MLLKHTQLKQRALSALDRLRLRPNVESNWRDLNKIVIDLQQLISLTRSKLISRNVNNDGEVEPEEVWRFCLATSDMRKMRNIDSYETYLKNLFDVYEGCRDELARRTFGAWAVPGPISLSTKRPA